MRNPARHNKRIAKNLQRLKLPRHLMDDPKGVKAYGELLVKELVKMEAEYTLWEERQEQWFLELLPWHEARIEHRRLQAIGQVPEVKWWEAASFFERAYPTNLTYNKRWKGLSTQTQRARLKSKDAAE